MPYSRRMTQPDKPIEFEDESIRPFQSIPDTYKKISFCLGLVMMYPNPHNQWKRLFGVSCMLLFVMPAYTFWMYDVILCIRRADINNIARQLALGMPVMFGQFKMVYINILSHRLRLIMDEIEEDYASYNHLDRFYLCIADKNRRIQLKLEKVWTVATACTVLVFPIFAIIKTTEHYLFRDGKRFMVHDMDVPGLREARYDTPYFEVLFVYVSLCGIQLGFSYVGFDGLFFVCVFHACLKLQMVASGLSKVFQESKDHRIMERRLNELIQQQCQAFRFVERLQEAFKVWLAMVYLITLAQLCVIMVQLLNVKDDMDPRFLFFLISAVLHIYMPCYLASQLSTAASDVGDAAYCSGWELVPPRLRRNLSFVIARGQIPMDITALNLEFNMQMFVNVMRSSYSVFTLLRK